MKRAVKKSSTCHLNMIRIRKKNQKSSNKIRYRKDGVGCVECGVRVRVIGGRSMGRSCYGVMGSVMGRSCYG